MAASQGCSQSYLQQPQLCNAQPRTVTVSSETVLGSVRCQLGLSSTCISEGNIIRKFCVDGMSQAAPRVAWVLSTCFHHHVASGVPFGSYTELPLLVKANLRTQKGRVTKIRIIRCHGSRCKNLSITKDSSYLKTLLRPPLNSLK